MVILVPELRGALLRAHSQSMPTGASDVQHAGSKEHRSVLVDFVERHPPTGYRCKVVRIDFGWLHHCPPSLAGTRCARNDGAIRRSPR
jgi:hypothetical protein